jgi:hypothetical protein
MTPTWVERNQPRSPTAGPGKVMIVHEGFYDSYPTDEVS